MSKFLLTSDWQIDFSNLQECEQSLDELLAADVEPLVRVWPRLACACWRKPCCAVLEEVRPICVITCWFRSESVSCCTLNACRPSDSSPWGVSTWPMLPKTTCSRE